MKIRRKIKNFFKKHISALKVEHYKKQNQLKNYYQALKGAKINVVFVCHRPAVWGYQKTIFEAMVKDKQFNISIVAIPNKKQVPGLYLNHEIYETEGAEEFFKDFPCKVVNGYNYETKEWFDLKSLNPHYVFFQQPYNVCRPAIYHSKEVNKFARICYIHYGLSMLGEHDVLKEFAYDFFQYTSLIFAETPYHQQTYIREISRHNRFFKFKNIFLTGCPAFDNLEQYKNSESPLWKHKNPKKLRIIWTPRWCTSERNCNFIEYKDKLFDYCEEKGYDFIFRPHPQAFLNYIDEGIMTEQDIESLKHRYNTSKNSHLDLSKPYLTALYSSDFLITDPSGILVEYILTEKPIIYTKKSNDWANNWAWKVMVETSYNVTSWQELQSTIEMLKNGNDPLKEKRQEIIKNEFYIPKEGAGYIIKELIKQDFMTKSSWFRSIINSIKINKDFYGKN